MGSRPSFLDPLIAQPGVLRALDNARTGRRLASRIDVAFDSKTRRRGLLGRDGMSEGSALVIAPCSAVHTCFMTFEIDVAFVDRQGRVLKTVHALPPWRAGGSLRGFAAIELPAGTLERSGTTPGDRLILVNT
jgi:uncharacterized membrane protein (UPF0127 family)